MKLTKEMKKPINSHLLVKFFKENAIPDLRSSLLELMDSVYDLEGKLDEFSELIDKKTIEAEELVNN